MHWSQEKWFRPQNNTVFTQNLYGQKKKGCYNKIKGSSIQKMYGNFAKTGGNENGNN